MKKIRNSAVKISSGDSLYESLDGISLDVDGVARVDRLILVDQKDGKEWEITISDGKLIYEPYNKEDKREYRINNILH